jgi:protein arginine N-methyltransferase 1
MADAALLEFHAFCLTDTGTRLLEYARALTCRVRPGDVVLDLGTGSGLLAMLACRAGASRVYAVETSEAIRAGELLASTTGFAERIHFIHASSTQVALPERVDVIVGDIHDTFGLQVGGVASFIDARDRLLKPGGSLIPSAVRLQVAPVEAPDTYARQVDVWTTTVEEVDLSPLRPLAVNQVHAARLGPAHLLAAPAELSVIDLSHATAPHAAGRVVSSARRDGVLHGVCGSFVSTLADDVTMSNAPGDSSTTNFAQAFFPVSQPVEVAEGDLIAMNVETYDGHIARWRVDVASPGRPPHARFEHSTFGGMLLSLDTLRRQADDYRPMITPKGAMERALLDRFDGASSAAELQRWLRDSYSALLPSDREAAALLKSTIERCG